jgi:mRNA interferase MazF
MTPSNAPRRGDVYWTVLDPARGAEMQKTRPCLVVTTDFINRRRRSVVIVPLSTTSPKEFPLYVPLPSAGENSQAVIDQIRVVDKGRVGDWIVSASEAEMEDIGEAMKMVFAIV